jgi:hypothetical protein
MLIAQLGKTLRHAARADVSTSAYQNHDSPLFPRGHYQLRNDYRAGLLASGSSSAYAFPRLRPVIAKFRSGNV